MMNYKRFINEAIGQAAVGTLIGIFIFILVAFALLTPIANEATRITQNASATNLSATQRTLVVLIPLMVVIAIAVSVVRSTSG